MFSEIADPYVKQFDLMTFGGWKLYKLCKFIYKRIHPLNRCGEAIHK
jgi:hypothetical protein